MSGLHLAVKEQQQLEQTLHHTHDARLYRHTLVILECSQGRHIKDVGQSLGMTRQSIHIRVAKLQQQCTAHPRTTQPIPIAPSIAAVQGAVDLRLEFFCHLP